MGIWAIVPRLCRPIPGQSNGGGGETVSERLKRGARFPGKQRERSNLAPLGQAVQDVMPQGIHASSGDVGIAIEIVRRVE